MTRTRLVAIHLVILLVIGGHAIVIALDPIPEAWPFSQYPMYSRRPPAFPRLTQRALFGIPATDPSIEIPLTDASYLAPLNVEYISGGFARILRSRDRARLDQALQDCSHVYEQRRREGLHDGPPLLGVRLYELAWNIDADLANVGRPARRLLAELRDP
jgi:hypothetical protein